MGEINFSILDATSSDIPGDDHRLGRSSAVWDWLSEFRKCRFQHMLFLLPINMLLPEEEQIQGTAVLGRITKVIGIRPSRMDLIKIIEHRNWTTLNRTERRLKRTVVAKLETMREQLLSELDTPAGAKALQEAYISILRREQSTKVAPAISAQGRPAVTTILFYLNRPGAHLQ
jgi:hypothetical protein